MGNSGACWRCKYFDRDPDDPDEGGYCRRYPPVATNDGRNCMWVGVGYMDWCGEFRDTDE